MRALILFLLAVSWLAYTSPAKAHAFLEQAAPKVGSTVDVSPTELRLRFSEAVEPAFSRITLATKDGGAIALGLVAVDSGDDRILVAVIPAPLPPGVYKVSWRAVSRDTHTTTGDFAFQVGR